MGSYTKSLDRCREVILICDFLDKWESQLNMICGGTKGKLSIYPIFSIQSIRNLRYGFHPTFI